MTRLITLRHVLILGIAITALRGVAQQPGLVMYGTVRDMATRDSIPYPNVHVQEAGTNLPPMPIVTNARGRYEIEFAEKKTYLIRYGAPGKVDKCLQLDLRGPSQEEWKGGYGMNIDVTLMDSLPGMDLSLFAELYGKARYDPSTGNFAWDMEYTQSVRDRQTAAIREYKERTGTSPPKE